MAKNVDIILQFQDRAKMCPARTPEHPRSLFCRSCARAPLWQTTLADLRALLLSSSRWPSSAGQTCSSSSAPLRPRPRKTPATLAFDRRIRLPISTDTSDFTRAKTSRIQTNKRTDKRYVMCCMRYAICDMSARHVRPPRAGFRKPALDHKQTNKPTNNQT